MSTTTGLPPNVAAYVEALRAELSDLAPEEREDLLSEVEPSLLEAAADDDEPIAARLGPPADFAADLRVSAGLPPAPRAAGAQPDSGRRATLRELARHPAVNRTANVLRELAPVWWVARAYVAVAALALVTGQSASDVAGYARYAEVPRLGGPAAGLLVLALATVASIAAGIAARRHPGRRRGALIAVNAVLVVLAIPVVEQLAEAESRQFPANAYYDAFTAPARAARLALRRRRPRQRVRLRPRRPPAPGRPPLRLARPAARLGRRLRQPRSPPGDRRGGGAAS